MIYNVRPSVCPNFSKEREITAGRDCGLAEWIINGICLFRFVSDGSSNTFKVFFKQPVQIEPDSYYTASVVLDGDELSYFGQEGMSEVYSGCVTFQFQCSAESTNGTGVQGGQIPELLFYGPSSLNASSDAASPAFDQSTSNSTN